MGDKMQAAYFEGEGKLDIRETDIPKIEKPTDMILKVEACSICGTDVHVLATPPGYFMEPGNVLGHELVGRVVEMGSGVTKFSVNDRVVVNPNEYCGNCCYCQLNLPNQCEHIIPMGLGGEGGFAEFIRVSEKMAFRIANDIPKSVAACAEPLACAVNGMDKLGVTPGSSVVIIGAGPIGLMFVQLMKASGAYPIIVSEPNEYRCSFAQKCGADYVINPTKQDLASFVLEKTGVGTDYAIDVVGTQMKPAIASVRKGGKVLLFGVNDRAEPAIKQSVVVKKELTIMGNWLANASFQKAVQILESGILELEKLVTHTMSLKELPEAIDILRAGNGIKIIIDMEK